MAKKSALLTLSSERDRDFILIDDETCFIKNKHEMSIVDYHRLRRCGTKAHKLFIQEELSEEDAVNLTSTINELIDFIFVDTPQATLNKLTEGQKFDIMMAFTKLLSENFPKGVVEEAEKEMMKETGSA